MLDDNERGASGGPAGAGAAATDVLDEGDRAPPGGSAGAGAAATGVCYEGVRAPPGAQPGGRGRRGSAMTASARARRLGRGGGDDDERAP